MLSHQEAQRDFLREQSLHELTTWFQANLHPVPGWDLGAREVSSHQSIQMQIVHAYEAIEPTDQQKVRESLANAIHDWEDPVALYTDVKIAVNIQASEVIPSCIQILEVDDSREDIFASKSLMVGFIASHTDSEVQKKIREWFDDPGFDWRLKLPIFNGLITADPTCLDELLPEMIALFELHSGYFRFDYFDFMLQDLIGPERFPQLLEELQLKGRYDDLSRS